MNTDQRKIIQIVTLATFLIMVFVNFLANALPINGVTAGQVSDSYQNLFAPAGATFAIWGLIYLLLAGYTLYQLGIFQGKTNTYKTELINKIGILFSVSSIANASWIFAWHYEIIPLSMLLMIVILVCLILINQLTGKEQFSKMEYFFVRLPFSVYFGWITVATIANATILLVSLGWKDFILSDVLWAIIVIFLGIVIAIATMLKNKDIAYGLVIVWAYSGILLKHISPEGFGYQYPAIINTTIVCIALLLLAVAYLVISKRKGRVKEKTSLH
ncbi:preprotein translocase subunit SecG [Methanohalophilus levihalophilus]|uniref:tryptophan-rich sensory protein n=1 Tax=Methanohalophilus levihalophilus TaxID=1431282 RepID=UPI001AE6FA04|nr:tryptophan-rich sensory protein [Methanohalophilus levihalophilus]MBP2030233.1 preprotein translocase subunit SecG [Methanohalophilus levihalophilus]